MEIPVEMVPLTLSFSIDVTFPTAGNYGAANMNNEVEKALTSELVTRFPARHRRLMLQIPVDPSKIILNTGAPHPNLRQYLTRKYIVSWIPGAPPIPPIPIMSEIGPGPLVQILYMYIGPREHRVIYIYGMQDVTTGSPVIVSIKDTVGNLLFEGKLLATISWGQSIADLIGDNQEERIAILEETAKVILKAH